VAKVHQELLGRYYNQKFDVDFRCLRYPGIMSSEEFESHGTTDYSTGLLLLSKYVYVVEIFFKALKDKRYVVYLKEDTALPMIHIDDAIEATLQFIETDNKCLTRRVYNLAGLSFTPKQLATEVKK
jgi:threonine 3-dehydrogenase